MAADGQSNGKSKGRKERAGSDPVDALGQKELSDDELEIIPTAVPREGDGYQVADKPSGGVAAGVIGSVGATLTEDDLPPRIRDHEAADVLVAAHDPSELVTLEEVERRYIRRVMEAVGGSKSEAARVLGLDRSTLYRKRDRYGVRAPGAASDD
jgi:hypothetical protein